MNGFPCLKIALYALLFFPMIPFASADPLSAFLQKNRLIVISLPNNGSRIEVAKNLAATFDSQRTEIEDRDLKVIDASSVPAAIPSAIRLSPEQTTALRKDLKLDDSARFPVFILIGKDGGEKARSTENLNLAKWFALIDGMPMRRTEIERKKQG